MEEILLNFGDIIWCDRSFESEVELDDHHKHGPYIVLEQKDGIIYGLKGHGISSGDPEYPKNIYVDGYKTDNMSILRKRTEFRVDVIRNIPQNFVINHIGTLSEDKKDEVHRKLVVTEIFNPGFLNKININHSINYSIGDIIGTEQDRFIIIDDKDPNYYRIIPYYQTFDANKFMYRFDLAIDVQKENNNFNLIGNVTKERKEKLINRYYQYRVNKKYDIDEHSKAKLGSVFLFENEFYYVCTIESNKLVCYKLQPAKEDKYHVEIEGRYFKTDFNQITIDTKNDSLHLLINLNEKQIDKIREYKKINKVNNKQPRRINAIKRNQYNYFGKILTLKSWPYTKYVAYTDDTIGELTCVDLEKLLDGEFELVQVFKYEVYYDKTTRSELIDALQKLDKEITDDRYRDFLVVNGLYDFVKSKKQMQRKRNFEKDI